MWKRAIRVCWPALTIGVVTLCLFQEFTRHPTDLLSGVHAGGSNDLTTAFLRFRDTPANLRQQFEHISHWDPHLQLGMPVHGNPQMALLSPASWISFLFGAEPTLSWILILHLWWGGVGSWALARRLEVGMLGSLFAGVASVAAPYLVAHTAEGHVAQLCTVAWIPWMLWAFEGFLRADGRHWRVLTFFIALAFFAGHVQEIYYLVLLLSATVAVIAVRCWRQAARSRAVSLLAHWLLVGAASLALVAADLVPIVLNSRHCVRSDALPIEVAGNGLQPAHLLQLVNPFALGGPADIDRERYGFYWEKLCYFGIVPLLLAVTGALLCWRRPAIKRLVLLTAIAFGFAFGSLTPIFSVSYRIIPMIGSFRMPSRTLFICSFGMAVLAGLGLDRLVRRAADSAAGTVGRSTTDSLASSPPVPPQLAPAQSTASHGTSPGAVLIAIACFVTTTIELGRHTERVLALVPRDSHRRDSQLSHFFKEHVGQQRVLVSQALYSDGEALRDHVYRVRGYEPVGQLRYFWMIDALFNVPDSQLEFAGFSEVRLDLLHKPVADLLGVKYVATGKRQPAPPGWKLVTTGTVPPLVQPRGMTPENLGFGIYENTTPLPRAFVIGNVVPSSSSGSAVDALEAIVPRQAVLLERDVLEPGPRAGFTPAEIERDAGDRIVVRTTAEQQGYLVLTDLYHPGWRATIDGQPAEVLPAYLGLRAVPVPAGNHRVEFTFSVPGQTSGCVVSLLSALIIAASTFRRSATARTA